MRTRCPCGQTLVIPQAQMRKRLRCPTCRRLLTFTGADAPGTQPDTSGAAAEADPEDRFPLRTVTLIVGGAAAALVLLMVVAGASWITVALVLLTGALVLQGLWLGALRMVILLVGMLLALLLAVPLGGALSGVMRSTFGVPRLLSGLVGTVVVALLFILALMVAATPVTRAILAKRRIAERLNRWAGLGLGALEGLALSLMICWGLAIIQPLAQTAARKVRAAGGSHALADAVDRTAQDARRSPFGRIAGAANPLREVTVVRIAVELGEVVTDERALRAFTEDPAIQALEGHPEVRAAVRQTREDEDIQRLVDERDIAGLLDNETVARLATDPALRRVLVKNQDVILQALKRARTQTDPPAP